MKKEVRYDPIQQRNSYLTSTDLASLKKRESIEPMTILQRVGQVVVVPGCLPHQVSFNCKFHSHLFFLGRKTAKMNLNQ